MSLCSHFANSFKLACFPTFDGTHLAYTLDVMMTSITYGSYPYRYI